MNWTRFIAVAIGTGIASSLTDWFFAGDWLHRRYTYREIWREGAEGRAIALTSPLPFLTCGVFTYVIARLGLTLWAVPPNWPSRCGCSVPCR
jgi:hypothetical protein